MGTPSGAQRKPVKHEIKPRDYAHVLPPCSAINRASNQRAMRTDCGKMNGRDARQQLHSASALLTPSSLEGIAIIPGKQ